MTCLALGLSPLLQRDTWDASTPAAAAIVLLSADPEILSTYSHQVSGIGTP